MNIALVDDDAFDLFAVSYLSKPCSRDRVFRTLDHILRLRTDGERRFSFSFDRQSCWRAPTGDTAAPS